MIKHVKNCVKNLWLIYVIARYKYYANIHIFIQRYVASNLKCVVIFEKKSGMAPARFEIAASVVRNISQSS